MIHIHKDNSHSLDNAQYAQEVKRTLKIVLVFNWFVAILKLIFGYVIHSASLIADGYHSFADGTSNIIGLLGMRIASQPRDVDHPYGHKKYETFASVFIGLLLILICFHILQESFGRLKTGKVPEVNFFSFLVVIFTMAINGIVMFYEYRKGKRIGSDILVSDSLHTRADILTSSSVIVSFIGVKLGFAIFDVIIALFIVIFISFSAYQILKQSARILCDTAVIETKEIENLVLGVKDIKKCHHVRTRGRYDDIHIDLHVLLDDRTPIKAAHDLSSEIEEILKKSFAGVTDVVVHIEPLSSERYHHGGS